MRNVKAFLVLAVVTAAVAAGAYVARDEAPSIPQSGERLFPSLLAAVNDVTRIEVKADEETVLLERGTAGWVVPAKSGYPADPDKVHQLVVGTAELRVLEPKTSSAELYPRIGVQGPGVDGAESMLVALRGAGGDALAELIVGARKSARGNAGASEIYVRRPSESQSWLVEGRLPLGGKVSDWVDDSVARISRERTRDVRVIHPDGETVAVRQKEPAGWDYVLRDVPEGMAVPEGDEWRVSDIGRGMADLDFDDVRAASDPPDGAVPGFTVEAETYDGLRVRMETVRAGEVTYGKLSAEFDESLVDPTLAADERLKDKLASADAVRAEAERLNAKWSGWLYAIKKFKSDYFNRRMADLVKAPEPPKAESNTDTAKPPTS
ncbi:MAG: DUF4340 domain-containing protein [Ectothiorhodospiraceae bacterium]|nr:DUF4340 domain-containing protein [Ectothiorhodospiraceae bacterium]